MVLPVCKYRAYFLYQYVNSYVQTKKCSSFASLYYISLKGKCRHVDKIAIIGCTGCTGCTDDLRHKQTECTQTGVIKIRTNLGQSPHDTIINSLLRQNGVVRSFWPNYGVIITPYANWVGIKAHAMIHMQSTNQNQPDITDVVNPVLSIATKTEICHH